MTVPSNSSPGGWSFPENDNVFRQNQLKLSVNSSIHADIEKYRYKELVDSFLKTIQGDWVDELLQCTQGYDEVNQEILKLLREEVEKENDLIAKQNEELLNQILKEKPELAEDQEQLMDVFKSLATPKIEINYEEAICLTPTVHRSWAESKNICQISKSIGGIGVRTASTQKLIREDQSVHKEIIDEKKGVLGSLSWRKEPTQENDLYG